jgi:hypothetical protein
VAEIVIASASEAIHRAAMKEWIASSLPLLAMTMHQTQLRDLAAHTREFFRTSRLSKNQRAQGKPGARCTRSLAWKMKNTTRA